MAETPRSALDLHMAAISKLDPAAMCESQNFPFVHIWPDGSTEFTETEEDFEFPDVSKILGSAWHHSVLEEAEEVTRDDNAISYRVVFTRRRDDDSILGKYEAIWLVTRSSGNWGVQFRHGAIELD